ncbi:MAG: preprotein translocase subunit YajC [Spirochaetales bacterium]|nr:preprotein translocase subunit YajC [Spirochaetales bacterium]
MEKLIFNLPLLQEGGGDPVMSLVQMVIPFALIIGVFYFLIFRPQQKKQKETKNMLESLKRGDKVVTIGGIHGTIFDVKEKSVVIKVDDNTKMEFLKNAISDRLTKEIAETEKKEIKAAKDADESVEENK